MAIHYAITNNWGWADENAACGNNFRRNKKLTADPSQVTCGKCRTLIGCEQLVEIEHIAPGKIAA